VSKTSDDFLAAALLGFWAHWQVFDGDRHEDFFRNVDEPITVRVFYDQNDRIIGAYRRECGSMQTVGRKTRNKRDQVLKWLYAQG
jgi:hypothetical protein